MVTAEHLSKLPHSNKASVSSNLKHLNFSRRLDVCLLFAPFICWRIPRLRSEWSKTDIKQLEKKTKLSSLSQDLQYFPSSHRESSKFSFQFLLHFLLVWKNHITHVNHPSSFKPSPVYKTPLGYQHWLNPSSPNCLLWTPQKAFTQPPACTRPMFMHRLR